jgi:1,4-alpha-glucan branching enzyme
VAPRPVSLRFRPALALAAAAGIALAVAIVPAGRPAGASRMVVEFRLSAPDAHHVALVGDFNSWKPASELQQIAPGVWTVSVSLEPGVYNYGFMVDGHTLRLDPLAPRVADGFGGESSRLTVLTPEVRS